jgi:transposase
MLSEQCQDVTLVFDKGNLSEDNMHHLAKENIHVAASLAPGHHKDLLAISADDYSSLEGTQWSGVRTYRTKKEVFGKGRTIVLVFSETFFSQQYASLSAQLTKCVRKLDQLAKRLERWRTDRLKGRAPTVASVRKSVREILAPRHMRELIRVDVIEQKRNPPAIRFHTDHKALEELVRTLLGKTILLTDNHHWTDEQIIEAYRGQAKIEDAFREMNNHHFLRWRPMFHWTDQKIRVHAFYCVLALTLTALLRKTLHEKGVTMSTEKMLKTLSDIKEIAIIYPGGAARPKVTLSRLTPTQNKIVKALNLDEFKTR